MTDMTSLGSLQDDGVSREGGQFHQMCFLSLMLTSQRLNVGWAAPLLLVVSCCRS